MNWFRMKSLLTNHKALVNSVTDDYERVRKGRCSLGILDYNAVLSLHEHNATKEGRRI